MNTKEKNSRFLFPFFSFVVFVLLSVSVSGEQKKLPKLFVHKVKLGEGVPRALESQIRNGIVLSVLNNFRGEYAIVDDEAIAVLYRQAEKLQKQGCSDEACMRQIADAIDADELISAEITGEAGRYRLTLKNQVRNAKTLQYSAKAVVSESFRPFQIDYYISEMAHSAVDPKYRVNKNGAPAAEAGEIDVSRIELKPVQGTDINVLEFKTEDGQAQAVVDVLRPRLQKGENYAKAGKYGDAIDEFNAILKSIRSRLSADTQKKMPDYISGIEARIQSAYTSIYRVKMEAVDAALKKESSADEKFLFETKKKYDEILGSCRKLDPHERNENFISAMEQRIAGVNIAISGIQEKRGDQFYGRYQFTEALKVYEGILASLNKSGDNAEYAVLRERMSKKIDAARMTGSSHLQNKIAALCQHAEKENFAEDVSKNPLEKKMHRREIEKALYEARELLDTTAFADERVNRMYAETYALVNKDRKKKLGDEHKIKNHEAFSRSYDTSNPAVWSEYQGKMNWKDAKAKCETEGMRLPTIGELKSAYAAGVTKSWKTDGMFYWSSTHYGSVSYFILGLAYGWDTSGNPESLRDVRCRPR